VRPSLWVGCVRLTASAAMIATARGLRQRRGGPLQTAAVTPTRRMASRTRRAGKSPGSQHAGTEGATSRTPEGDADKRPAAPHAIDGKQPNSLCLSRGIREGAIDGGEPAPPSTCPSAGASVP